MNCCFYAITLVLIGHKNKELTYKDGSCIFKMVREGLKGVMTSCTYTYTVPLLSPIGQERNISYK